MSNAVNIIIIVLIGLALLWFFTRKKKVKREKSMWDSDTGKPRPSAIKIQKNQEVIVARYIESINKSVEKIVESLIGVQGCIPYKREQVFENTVPEPDAYYYIKGTKRFEFRQISNLKEIGEMEIVYNENKTPEVCLVAGIKLKKVPRSEPWVHITGIKSIRIIGKGDYKRIIMKIDTALKSNMRVIGSIKKRIQ
jgi:predicted small integral membrane protein